MVSNADGRIVAQVATAKFLELLPEFGSCPFPFSHAAISGAAHGAGLTTSASSFSAQDRRFAPTPKFLIWAVTVVDLDCAVRFLRRLIRAVSGALQSIQQPLNFTGTSVITHFFAGFVARRLGASAVVLSDSRPEALRDLQLNAALTLLCEANSHGNFIDTSHFGSGGVAQICHHRLKAFAELTRKGLAVKRITAKGEEEESILASESSSSELLTTKQQHNESLFSNAKFRVGQLVEVNYKQRGKFYPGKVDAIRLVQEEIVQSSVDDGEPPGEHFVIVVNTPARLEAALSAAKLAGACVVLDFFAEWCDPCTAIKPVVQALAEVRPDVLVVAVDVDECRSISDEQYNVTTMPTFVALDPNGQELARVVGADGEGLTVLVSELPPALSRQADSDGMIVPWRKLVDAQDQDVSSSSQSSSRMRTVPKYDVAYLDGDFEGGVAEDAIQHRHTYVDSCSVCTTHDFCIQCHSSHGNF